MKAILRSMKPEGCVRILNGKQTIIVEKTVPKEWADYLSGKTKEKPKPRKTYICCMKNGVVVEKDCGLGFPEPINGKVVAKFTLREVEEIKFHLLTKTNSYGLKRIEPTFTTETLSFRELKKLSCLTCDDLIEYLNNANGYAWHISDLVIFDEQKELSEFKQVKLPNPKKIKFANWEANYYWALGDYCIKHPQMTVSEINRTFDESISVKRVPHSWQYVEARE